MNRAQAPAHVLLLAACAWASACGLNEKGVDPPSNTIAYPASAVMDRTGHWLLVTNSNADLRFNDGSLMAFSLKRAADDRKIPRDQCPAVNYANPIKDPSDFCCRDPLDPNIMNCDERSYIGADGDTEHKGLGNVRIGSFAAGMVLQTTADTTLYPILQPACPTLGANGDQCTLCAGFHSTDDRVLIGVRGDTSLTFVDIQSVDAATPPKLKCVGPVTMPDENPPDFATCDADHRIVTAMSGLASPSPDQNPPDIPLPDEPYALALDPGDGLLFIGHLTGNTARAFTGGFSLFDVAPRGDDPMEQATSHLREPRFIAPFSSPFTPSGVGAVGVTALTTFAGTVYASSRYTPQVVGLGTTAQCPIGGANIREIAAFPNGTTFSSPLAGSETRGIQFVGNRAFILQRTPPALIGFLNGAATDVLETCGSPTFLDKHNNGVGDRLFVSCFADGEIYVYDPAIPQLVKTFPVGRGPSGLVFDDTPDDNGDPRNVAYVVGFGDNNVSVIDLKPGSETEYHVIQRIGFPRVTPR